MKGILLFFSISILLGVSGCSKSVPSCSATEATDLVKEVTNSEMIKQMGPEAEGMFSYALNSIRTTNTNEQTGAQQCAAELEVTFKESNETVSGPVSYSVELTDDGKEIYVNVYEI